MGIVRKRDSNVSPSFAAGIIIGLVVTEDPPPAPATTDEQFAGGEDDDHGDDWKNES